MPNLPSSLAPSARHPIAPSLLPPPHPPSPPPPGEDEELTLIDFPQMVSVTHANAEELFVRDVECIVRFFSKKIG